MCGIAGFVQKESHTKAWHDDTISAMTGSLHHRGPDSSGTWIDHENGVALGHRRLSILDLSSSGHQPMVSQDRRYIITLNGEIYNFRTLRSELEKEGFEFKGSSDTEVALALIQSRGVERAIPSLIGMFAFAVWDRHEKRLTLARDRAGEKPLYYGGAGNFFFFASELKAFQELPGWSPEIDSDSLGLLVRHCYIPGPRTIYKNVFKLLPGAYISLDSASRELSSEPQEYWSASEIAHATVRLQNDEEGIANVEKSLLKAVKSQMVSDVPLGGFLSGGVDSSLIVAMMQEQSTSNVRTFSIGFDETEYNEAPYAAAVAKHLGTDHTELYVSPKQALEVIPLLPEIYDEPFADSSQIPTYLLSKLTREHVTVALSGDGGDEMFGGYGRYEVARNRYDSVVNSHGKPIRKTAYGLSVSLLRALQRVFAKQPFGDKLEGIKNLITAPQGAATPETMNKIYRQLLILWPEPGALVNDFGGADALEEMISKLDGMSDFTERMMLTDFYTYLSGDILVKVDRASMACSLEVRAPFLDRRVIESAWSVSPHARIKNGVGKWPLRSILYKYVPRELIDRPKMGFGVPIDHWLRKELRDWGEELLSEQALTRHGFFNARPIREKWEAHQKNEASWHYWLWPILMFQAWYAHYEK